MGHPLLQSAPSGARRTIQVGDNSVTFCRPAFCGDLVFRVLYPDPIEARQMLTHAASVNGRPSPYPQECFGAATAILGTLETGEPLDVVGLLTLYDSDPLTWDRATEAALTVLGLIEDQSPVTGLPAWESVHRALAEGPSGVARARAVAAQAIRTLRPVADVSEDVLADPVMESVLGNSSEADPSFGPASA